MVTKLTALRSNKGIKHEGPVRSLSPIKRFIRYAVAASASILLVILGVMAYNFYTLSPQKLFTDNYRVYEFNSGRDDSTGYTKLENAYRAKDYQAVIKLSTKPDSSNIKENFLLASSYTELKNYPRAIQNYNKVLKENERKGTLFLNDETEYYLALAYLRNRDYDLALDLMENINNNPAHLYHSKVTSKLIRKVKMLKWR